MIIESTCPVGTTEKVLNLLEQLSSVNLKDINIAYCPERVIPGQIINELKNNDRVVGGNTKLALKMATKFYKSFCKGKIYMTNSATAELVKLTENSFRDINIAFANEISMISDKFSIDAKELIYLANRHPE